MKKYSGLCGGNAGTVGTAPVWPVDSLVLSQFSYIHLEEFVQGPAGVSTPVSLKELLRAECFDSLFYRVRAPQEKPSPVVCAAASPRFRDIGAVCAVNDLNPDLQKQFSAVTFCWGTIRFTWHFVEPMPL